MKAFIPSFGLSYVLVQEPLCISLRKDFPCCSSVAGGMQQLGSRHLGAGSSQWTDFLNNVFWWKKSMEEKKKRKSKAKEEKMLCSTWSHLKKQKLPCVLHQPMTSHHPWGCAPPAQGGRGVQESGAECLDLGLENPHPCPAWGLLDSDSFA